MSAKEHFEETCAQVCRDQGWIHHGEGIEVKLDSGRQQKVALEYFDFEDQELARIYTVIGDASRVNPLKLTEALRLNFGLPHGALALRGEELVVIDTLLLEDADPGEIEAAVAYLAELGDQLESSMFGTDLH